MKKDTLQLLSCLQFLYGERVASFAALLIGDSDDWHWADILASGWENDAPYWLKLPMRAGFDPEKLLGHSENSTGWYRNALWKLLARCRRKDWEWLCLEIARCVDNVENRWILPERLEFKNHHTPERADLLQWINEAIAKEPERFGKNRLLPPPQP